MLTVNAANCEIIGFEYKEYQPMIVIEKDEVKEINLSNIYMINKQSLNVVGVFLISIVKKIGTKNIRKFKLETSE